MTIHSFAIIGTGAVGGFCAVKLKQAGFDVHCLLRSDYDYVTQNGLTVTSQAESITLPINAYKNVGDMPKCDVIIFAIKSTENVILKELLPKIIHENSLVVVFQNGIGIENQIAEYISAKQIIGASTIIKVTKVSPGTIKYYGFGVVEFAQYFKNSQHKEITESVIQLANIFKKTGFDSSPASHLPSARWKKLIANIPISGLSVVLNASTKKLITHSASYALLISLTQEVIETAKKCGAELPDDIFQIRLNIFEKIKTMEESNFSMKDDFDAKKPLELEAIYKNAINIAESNGVSMPLTKMLYKQLLYLNEKNYENS